MKSEELEEAVDARNDCENITEFLIGYAPNPANSADKGWEGKVALSFGTYECAVSMEVKEELLRVLYAQRAKHVCKLRKWGIDHDTVIEDERARSEGDATSDNPRK